MELRHLRYFVTLAEELHFGRAAEHLYIAQPSLSRQIHNLEEELRTVLLERGPRGITLTEAGRLFVTEAKAILRDVDRAAEIARRGQAGEIGQLRIGFVTIAALSTLPALLQPYRAAYPFVELELLEMPSEQQIASILKGTLDVGVVRQPFSIAETLAACRLSEDAQIIALPVDHPLAEQEIVNLSQLRTEPLITFSRKGGPATYDAIIGACARAGFSPNIVQEALRITTIVGLVSVGVGIAILPPSATYINHPNVAYRKLVPEMIVETGLVWDPAKIKERPALGAFLRVAVPEEERRVSLAPRKRSHRVY